MPVPLSRGSASLALLLVAALSLAAAPQGLIDQPQTFPWSVGLGPSALEEAGGLASGAFRVQSSVLWFNTYRQNWNDTEITQQVDMEGLLETLSAAWSPAPGWELRGQVQGWVLGGGIMDAFLSGFHETLGLNNQGRESVSAGQYHDYLKGYFDLGSPVSGLTQLSLGTRFHSGQWSWSGWIKPPLPAPVDWAWTGQWAGGVGAGWGDSWPWPEAGLHIGAGASLALVVAEEDPDFPGATGILAPQFGVYGSISGKWGARALVEGSWTRVPRSGEGYLSQGAGLLTMGIQWPLGRTTTIEAALTEEFLTWATMEVGFQAGIVWTP